MIAGAIAQSDDFGKLLQNVGVLVHTRKCQLEVPVSFFRDFGIDFEGQGVVIESFGPSVSKVIFERMLGRASGLGNTPS